MKTKKTKMLMRHTRSLFAFLCFYKNAKRELGQYPTILISRLVNNRDLKIRRRRVSTTVALSWGGMGRGRRRMARKLPLRSSGGRGRLHNKVSVAFGILVKVWHPLEIYVTFSSKVLMTITYLRINFFAFTMQTLRKTQVSLMTAMDRLT